MFPIIRYLNILLIVITIIFSTDAEYYEIKKCLINCSNNQKSNCYSKSDLHFKWCLMKKREIKDNCVKVCTVF